MIEILLVDDEAIVGKRLKPALERKGYQVEFYDTGAAAVARLAQHAFDVVVTDMRMGEVTGIDVLEAALLQRSTAKVIVISGFATMEMAREARVKGACEVIAKPFKPKDLHRAIAQALAALEREA